MSQYKLRKLSKESVMTFDITVTREFELRVKVAVLLMRLASWLLGIKFESTVKKEGA